jgi:hypothetical protein
MWALVRQNEPVGRDETETVRVDKVNCEVCDVRHRAWSIQFQVLNFPKICWWIESGGMKFFQWGDAIGISIKIPPSFEGESKSVYSPRFKSDNHTETAWQGAGSLWNYECQLSNRQNHTAMCNKPWQEKITQLGRGFFSKGVPAGGFPIAWTTCTVDQI